MLLLACKAEYKTYGQYKKELKAQNKPTTRSEFIHDYLTCEKHNKRMHRAILPVKYGVVCTYPQPNASAPNPYYTICGGGTLKKPRFVAKPVCKTCSKEFKSTQ